jgi:hypothetical protein
MIMLFDVLHCTVMCCDIYPPAYLPVACLQSLFGQCAGFLEWCLQQHSLTRANDTSLSHPPSVALRRLQLPKEPALSASSGIGEGMGMGMGGISSFTEGIASLDTLPALSSALSGGTSSSSSSSSSHINTSKSGGGGGGGDEDAAGDSLYSLTRAADKEVSLAGLCYSQPTTSSSSSSSNPIVHSCKDAIRVRREIESEFLEMVRDGASEEEVAACVSLCKQEVFARAMERNNSTHMLKKALQNNWKQLLRNNNGEVFFSMRKTIASQLGVLGAVSYLLQCGAPTARASLLSMHDGRVMSFNMKPGAAALSEPKMAAPSSPLPMGGSGSAGAGVVQEEDAGEDKMEMDVEEVTVGGGAQEDAVFLRLSPSVLSALSMRLVNSTLKAALGNTAVAISKQKSLTEVRTYT